jgi:hypothetical protein
MTLTEIVNSTKEALTPADVAEVLGCEPYSISVQVREDKQNGVNSFPFPTIRIGTRTKIPRRAFLKAMGVGEEEIK